MRPIIIFALTALALGACRNRDQADNALDLNQNLTAANIVSNDVTAIDAVTAESANMAADVDYADALNALSNNAGDSAGPRAKSGAARPGPASPPSAPAATDSANSATNAQ